LEPREQLFGHKDEKTRGAGSDRARTLAGRTPWRTWPAAHLEFFAVSALLSPRARMAVRRAPELCSRREARSGYLLAARAPLQNCSGSSTRDRKRGREFVESEPRLTELSSTRAAFASQKLRRAARGAWQATRGEFAAPLSAIKNSGPGGKKKGGGEFFFKNFRGIFFFGFFFFFFFFSLFY